MTFGSLFAGIGGFDLGLERAGMTCRWQVENDPFCQKILKKHWKKVGRWDDVKTFPPSPAQDWEVDLICGGFPCQDVSNAGKRKGIKGKRSGLWKEFARIIRILRPKVVLVENVTGLLNRGMGDVLGDLAALGYDAEWDCVSANSVGAPHERQRIFIVAYPTSIRCDRGSIFKITMGQAKQQKQHGRILYWPGIFHRGRSRPARIRWIPHSSVCRMVDGIPDKLEYDRYKSLGNSVVPQVAELIGRRIMENFNGIVQEASPHII